MPQAVPNASARDSLRQSVFGFQSTRA